MSLKVIGAGYGRTGTKSLKEALEILGFDKCYHMEELFENPQGVGTWEQAEKGRAVDWDSLFKGYQAIVDFPGSIHYKKLMEHYPDAKIILTIRDPERWYNSARKTIYSFDIGIGLKLKLLLTLPFSATSRQVLRIIRLIETTIWKGFFKGRFEDRAYAIQHFNDHIQAVKKTVPPDRLLIFQAKEGWEPLCQFLGAEVPAQPYPSSNKKDGFHQNDREMIRRVLSGRTV